MTRTPLAGPLSAPVNLPGGIRRTLILDSINRLRSRVFATFVPGFLAAPASTLWEPDRNDATSVQ
jgi:hypothetical protein